MEPLPTGQTHAPIPTAGGNTPAGLYVYCIAAVLEEVNLGSIGIEGSQVYTLAHNGLCAAVHDCSAQPYQSSDAKLATTWVLAHHRVVETAWKRWGTVLPMTFNTIVTAGEKNARENLKAWIETGHECLRSRLEALAGKAEYSVQVFWDAALASREIARANPQIKTLQAETASRPRGLAYMHRQRLEGLLRKEIEARAAQESQELYQRLCRCVESIRVEKVRRTQEGSQMLLNLSCLVATERYPELEVEVDSIDRRESCSARLAGPFPPYSFC